MVEILKQNQYVPMDVEKQIAIIFAASKGQLDDLNVEEISEFEAGLFEYLDANASAILVSIVNEGTISEETREKIENAISEFKAGFKA